MCVSPGKDAGADAESDGKDAELPICKRDVSDGAPEAALRNCWRGFTEWIAARGGALFIGAGAVVADGCVAIEFAVAEFPCWG